jgi:hypothetical protein
MSTTEKPAGRERSASSRRKFLAGLAGAGVSIAAVAAVRPKGAKAAPAPLGKGPVLFQHGPEAERYYKTLDR